MSQLTHKFKAEHADKVLHVPGGYPSTTVEARYLTQAHIDAFDEDTKAYFFEPTGYKPNRNAERKNAEKAEEQPQTKEEIQAELADLEEKYESYSDKGKSGRHGQAALSRIEELKQQLTSLEPMEEKKEWDPQASHTLEEIKERIAELRHKVLMGAGGEGDTAEIDELGKQVNILTTEINNPTSGPTINAAGQINAPAQEGESGEEKSESEDKE